MATLKTKVLHIITRLDRGGSAANTLLTVIGLSKDRYEVTLVSGPSSNPMEQLIDRAQAAGVKLVIIDDLIRAISPLRDVKALFVIYKFIRDGKYDIVHTHSSKAGILGRWAAYMAGVSYIVHTPHGHIFYGYYNKIVTGFFVLIERAAASISNMIVALTEKEIKDHLESGIATPAKYTVIHSGVELAAFGKIKISDNKIKSELGIPLHSPVVGSVGRLEKVKGYKYFIEAIPQILKKVPETYFMLVGDGNLRDELTRQCSDSEVGQRIVFTGWRNDIPQVLSVMNIFVLSSLNEGMGKVLVEAMALKKPIIATRVGGVPMLIKDKENGILIPPENSPALATAVIDLLTDESKAKKLCEEAGKGVRQYSAREMVRKIDNLYEKLVN